jgi:DNA adenine methylase
VPYVLTHNCDPPYLPLTRTDPARQGYAHDMSYEDHVRLLETVTRLRGHALVSGYHSPLYDDTLAGWRCLEIATYASSATPKRSQRPRRTECVWLSPGAVVQPALF